MSDPQTSSTEALDAVEEQLNLKKESATANSTDDTGGNGVVHDKKDVNQNHLKRSAMSAVMNQFNHIMNFIQEKLHMNAAKKEKLKMFSTSNMGITLIVLFVVVICIGISVVWHHHAPPSRATSSSAWNAPISQHNVARFSVPTQRHKDSALKSSVMAQQGAPSTTVTSAQIKNMMQTLSDLSEQMKGLNQRMMVISQQLTHQSHHTRVNRHYRILGWRLDQDTNQWVADIDYEGQVKAYYPGQHFGKWTVWKVTANGVKIR